MGLFDKFKNKKKHNDIAEKCDSLSNALNTLEETKKSENNQPQNHAQNANLLAIAIKETCSNLVQFVRDANLPYEITHKYQKGMIIKERGFVDATALSGGITTSHRYIILSNHIHMLPTPDKEWALCVANNNSRFLVLGKAEEKGKRVTVLLHLHNNSWRLFKSVNMIIFQDLLNDCYDSFKQCIDKEPIASVSTEEWLNRCTFPIGMSDNGVFFPIEDEIQN